MNIRFRTTTLVISGLFLTSFAPKMQMQIQDPIYGKWSMRTINGQDISALKCYKDSYIQAKPKNIAIQILELTPEETCKPMMQGIYSLEKKTDGYYVNDLVMDFSVKEKVLTWKPNPGLEITFQKVEE